MADLFILLSLLCFVRDIFGEECYNSFYGETYQCDIGCCGSDIDRDCCSLVGIIIGAVIGGIFFISITIAVICCCIKTKGKTGRVMTGETVPTAPIQDTSHLAYPRQNINQPGFSANVWGSPMYNNSPQYDIAPAPYSNPGFQQNFGPPPSYASATQGHHP